MVANILRCPREERRKRGICGEGIPPEVEEKEELTSLKKAIFWFIALEKRECSRYCSRIVQCVLQAPTTMLSSTKWQISTGFS